MEFIGSILAPADPPGIDRSRWHAVIQSHANLKPQEPKELLNPFTKKHELSEPNPDIASVIVGSREVGTMRLVGRGASEIHVYGDEQAVSPIAREVAELVGGRYDPEALRARNPAGRVLERVGSSVDVGAEPDEFLRQFRALKPEVGHLYAAHFCQSEVRNGGFHQFFFNSTGVLAPEALAGFRAISLAAWADILAEAMQPFGEPYPRDRRTRQRILKRIPVKRKGDRDPFAALDNRFYEWLRDDPARFQKAADEFAVMIAS